MIRNNRSFPSRWLGRRITGSCGGGGDAAPKASNECRGPLWTGPKSGRDYGYVISREIEEK